MMSLRNTGVCGTLDRLTDEAAIEIKHKCFQACALLAGVDKSKCGSVLDELNDAFINGVLHNNCSESVEATVSTCCYTAVKMSKTMTRNQVPK